MASECGIFVTGLGCKELQRRCFGPGQGRNKGTSGLMLLLSVTTNKLSVGRYHFHKFSAFQLLLFGPSQKAAYHPLTQLLPTYYDVLKSVNKHPAWSSLCSVQARSIGCVNVTKALEANISQALT